MKSRNQLQTSSSPRLKRQRKLLGQNDAKTQFSCSGCRGNLYGPCTGRYKIKLSCNTQISSACSAEWWVSNWNCHGLMCWKHFITHIMQGSALQLSTTAFCLSSHRLILHVKHVMKCITGYELSFNLIICYNSQCTMQRLEPCSNILMEIGRVSNIFYSNPQWTFLFVTLFLEGFLLQSALFIFTSLIHR